MLLLYIESKDIQKTFMTFAASKDAFDLWFVEEMKKNTGVDFNQPMPGLLPEMLISRARFEYDTTFKGELERR